MAPTRTHSTQVKHWVVLYQIWFYLLVAPMAFLVLKFSPLSNPTATMDLYNSFQIITSTCDSKKRCFESKPPIQFTDHDIIDVATIAATVLFYLAISLGWLAALVELAKIKHWSAICWSIAASFAIAQCCKIYSVDGNDAAFCTAMASAVVAYVYLCDEMILLSTETLEEWKETLEEWTEKLKEWKEKSKEWKETLEKKQKECSDVRESKGNPA